MLILQYIGIFMTILSIFFCGFSLGNLNELKRSRRILNLWNETIDKWVSDSVKFHKEIERLENELKIEKELKQNK